MTQLLELLMHPEQKWSLFSEAAFAQAAHGGRAVVDSFEKTYLSTVTVSAAKMRRRVRFDATNVSENLSAWRLFLSLSNMAYLDPILAQVEVIESAVEDAVAHEVLPDTPVSEPAEPPEAVEMTLEWTEAVDAFADEPEVAAALRAMAAAGLPEPDADSVGGEVSGVPVVAQWPQHKVLLLFAEDAEDLRATFEAEGYAVFGADFDSVPDPLTAALSAS